MYFSRLQPRADADRATLVRQLRHRDSYRDHQLLWQLFPGSPDQGRDFLFRRDDHQGLPRYYVVSRRIPEDPTGAWLVEAKEYSPSLRNGQSLAFSLRANPVITRKDAQGRARRHDLVMDLKWRGKWKDSRMSERDPMQVLVQRAGEIWLTARLAKAGAALNALRADGYRQHRTGKSSRKPPIRFSSLDLRGTLTLTDAEPFTEALYHGIGPAKSFGCGLLLVRQDPRIPP